jgi:hypothetical protein
VVDDDPGIRQMLQGSSTRAIAMTDGGATRRFNLLGLAELLGAVRTIEKPFTLDAILALVKQELAGN